VWRANNGREKEMLRLVASCCLYLFVLRSAARRSAPLQDAALHCKTQRSAARRSARCKTQRSAARRSAPLQDAKAHRCSCSCTCHQCNHLQQDCERYFLTSCSSPGGNTLFKVLIKVLTRDFVLCFAYIRRALVEKS
jgi:hypothetical protein